MKDLLNDLLFSDEEILNEYKMKKLVRYNTRNRIDNEDIAQHSFFVSMFCLKIFKLLDLDIETKYEILVKAILHDACEIETSDIPYDVKIKYPEVKELLDNIEKKYYKKNWKEYERIVEKGNNDIVSLVVKLADIYSVRQYALNEQNVGNKDKEMLEILENTQNRLEDQILKINEIITGGKKCQRIMN